MAPAFLLLIAGTLLVIIGASTLVRGAADLEAALGTPPLIIGLTIVAFGTSSPELVVSVQAALQGETQIALGNVVGSNIFNVLFILGISALVAPLVVSVQVVRQEVPIMIVASFVVLALAANGSIGRAEGALLVAALIAYTAVPGMDATTALRLWLLRASRTWSALPDRPPAHPRHPRPPPRL